MGRRILVVEDDREISEIVRLHLSDAGYAVEGVADGETALARLGKDPFDLVVLDLTLPFRVDGLEVCRALRSRADYTPILMLTARAAELDRVIGLEVGADDYLTKPFSVRELVARVKALFRRIEVIAEQRDAVAPGPVRVGPLTIDPERRQVTVGTQQIDVTAKEFDLLFEFARHPGRVFTRAQLLERVWGYGRGGYEHTVNSHINRLRAKIETDPASPRYVRTVWGVGYKFCDPDEAR